MLDGEMSEYVTLISSVTIPADVMSGSVTLTSTGKMTASDTFARSMPIATDAVAVPEIESAGDHAMLGLRNADRPRGARLPVAEATSVVPARRGHNARVCLAAE